MSHTPQVFHTQEFCRPCRGHLASQKARALGWAKHPGGQYTHPLPLLRADHFSRGAAVLGTAAPRFSAHETVTARGRWATSPRATSPSRWARPWRPGFAGGRHPRQRATALFPAIDMLPKCGGACISALRRPTARRIDPLRCSPSGVQPCWAPRGRPSAPLAERCGKCARGRGPVRPARPVHAPAA